MKKSIFINPFICRSESMPENIVLLGKILVAGLIMKGYFNQMSDHFLPFWPIFDHMGSPQFFKTVLQAIFVFGAVGVLFTRWLRVSCFLLALAFGVTVLSSKLGYSNVKFFCTCFFFIIAVAEAKTAVLLLRYQMSIMYFGAALNKVCEIDWRTGQYFEYWMGSILKREAYTRATDFLPPMMLSKIMCWSSIITEFFLSVSFLLKPLNYFTLWLGIYFHSMAFLLSWQEFNVFTIAILASYLILVQWPKIITMRYDAKKFIHRSIKSLFSAVDWDQRIQWQAEEGKLRMNTDQSSSQGFIAFKRLIFYSPVMYFCFAAILGLPESYLWIKLKSVQVALVFFFPWPEILQCIKSRNKEK